MEMIESPTTFTSRLLHLFVLCEGADGFFFAEPKTGDVKVYVNCNDLFWWACADAEEVTPENIGDLEAAVADVMPMYEAWDPTAHDSPLVMPSMGLLLFCARQRKMRPQGAFYECFPPALAALFDAAGPDRADDRGDTRRRPWSPRAAPPQTTADPPWRCRECRAREAAPLAEERAARAEHTEDGPGLQTGRED